MPVSMANKKAWENAGGRGKFQVKWKKKTGIQHSESVKTERRERKSNKGKSAFAPRLLKGRLAHLG